MVVVAIVAILAAVALPMYSSFRQKSKVSRILNSCGGVLSAFQGWYDDYNSFVGLAVDDDGGSISFNTDTKVGAGLPEISYVSWSITNTTTSSARISWTFTETCPSGVCDGYYQITCFPDNDRCDVYIFLDSDNTLGFNTL